MSTATSNTPIPAMNGVDLPEGRRGLAPWVGVAVGIAALFAGTFLYFLLDPTGPRAFLLGDAWIFSLPNQFYLDRTIHRGEFPFWNPLAFCGTPFAADPQALAFYPLNLLRSVLTLPPTPLATQTSWNLLLFVHFQIAGLGTYFLARQYGLSRAAAWTAVIGYVCSSQFVFNMVTWVYHIPNVTWQPWILFFLNKAFSSRQPSARRHYTVCAALAYGVQLLSGGPLFMALTTLLAGSALLSHLVCPPTILPGAADGPAVSRARRNARNILGFGVFLGIGLLMAAAYLIASTEFAFHSVRADLVMDSYRANFMPHCDYTLRDMIELSFVYSGTRGRPAIMFSGACMTVLGLAALLHPNRRATVFFAVLLFALWDIMRLGKVPDVETPLAYVLDKITPFNVLRTEGWLCAVLTGLPLGILAGFGVDAIAKGLSDSTRSRMLASAAVLCLGATALVSIGVWVPELPLARNVLGLTPHAAARLYSIVPVLFFVVLIASIWRPSWRRMAFVLPLLAFCETFVWNSAIPLKVETDAIFPCVLPMERLVTAPDWPSKNSRLAYRTQDCAMLGLWPNIGGYNPIYLASSARALLRNDQYETNYTRFMESDTASVNLRWHQFLKRPFWLSRQIAKGELPGMQTLYPAAATVYMASPPADARVPIVDPGAIEGNAASAAAIKTPLPAPIPADTPRGAPNRAWTLAPFRSPAQHSALCLRLICDGGGAVQVTAYRNNSELPLHLRDTQIPAGPRGPLLIEAPLPDIDGEIGGTRIEFTPASPDAVLQIEEVYLLTDTQDENGLIQVVSLGANHSEVHIGHLPEDRVFTFVDPIYPGWRAYVDARPAPIYLSNGAFKSVLLGPGPHTVRFEYVPLHIYAGLCVSGTAGVLAACYLVWSARRMRREHARAS